MIRITIEKVTKVDKISKDWKRVRDRFDTADEEAKADKKLDGQYKYVETEITETETEKIYQQFLDDKDFNLKNVINNINK